MINLYFRLMVYKKSNHIKHKKQNKKIKYTFPQIRFPHDSYTSVLKT